MSYNLGIREFIDQAYYDITRKMDDLVYSSFRSLGYTRDWIFRNLDRISIDQISSPLYTDHIIYKIFTGNFMQHCISAERKFNQWAKENPSIDILEFKYSQANNGDHSICILYKEVSE